ncbi:MAG TPA: prenyltransferase/squalene oxidase repeat-containing protein, partial [Tepidisphaeraceae bacterium]|nr:prenyltransferase/squalene oxidase repeat-containing protein [Tepidisphaeraceae bacterium]
MTNARRNVMTAVLAGSITLCPIGLLASQTNNSKAAITESQNPSAQAEAMVEKGLDFLKAHQEPDGSWQQQNDFPAMTAITLKAFVQDPHYKGDEPFLKKAFDKLLSFQKDDGSIAEDSLATYNTAIAISALAESKQPQYKPAMTKALTYLRQLEFWDKVQGVPAHMQVPQADPNYGGFTYNKKRTAADLSNTQVALDALHDAGLNANDPSFQAALKFVTRTQNNSETNPEKWAIDDGGFIYTSANGGNSKAG